MTAVITVSVNTPSWVGGPVRTCFKPNFKQETVIIRNNRGTKRLASLLLTYVAFPLVVCALIILIKSQLLSVISLEWSKGWIFQTLIDHWLECFLIGIINFNTLMKWMRGRGK